MSESLQTLREDAGRYKDVLIKMLWPDWLKCEDVWVPNQMSAKGLSITLQKSNEHTTYLHLMVYFETSHYVPQSWDVWEHSFSSKMGDNNGQEFHGIKYIHWRKMDHSMSRCKRIVFISSQLPQVTLGMLEIMKYKIPPLHITYFPHHHLHCRFTIMPTSKLRKLFLYSKQRVPLPLLGQQFNVYSVFGSLQHVPQSQPKTILKCMTTKTEQERILRNPWAQVRSKNTSVTSEREANHKRIHQGNQFFNILWSLKSNQKI